MRTGVTVADAHGVRSSPRYVRKPSVCAVQLWRARDRTRPTAAGRSVRGSTAGIRVERSSGTTAQGQQFRPKLPSALSNKLAHRPRAVPHWSAGALRRQHPCQRKLGTPPFNAL